MKNYLQNIKSFFGISVLTTIYLIFILFSDGIDTNLNKLDLVSIATFSNYSITKLVYTYYSLIFGGLCFLILITVLLSIVYDKSSRFRSIAKTLNPLGYLSFLVILFSLAITKNQEVVHLYMIICGLSVIHYLFFSKIENSENNLTENLFYFIIFLSLAAAIGLKDFLFVLKITEFSIFITFPILFLLFSGIIRFLSEKISISKIFLISIPIFFLPLLSFLKTEIFMIFNQHGISLHSPKLLWICGGIIILISMIILTFKGKNKTSTEKNLYDIIFPTLTIGIICWLYNPFFTVSDDLFETANPANAIFRSIEYWEIPFVDYLSSHAMSETLFCFCYVLFNGYSGICDFFIYDFLYNVIFFIIIYFFLCKILGKTPLLFFIFLFFPFLFSIFTKGLIFSFVLIFLWYKFFNNQNFKYLVITYMATILTVFWRFDLGLPCVLISGIFSLCWLLYTFSKEKLFLVCKAFAAIAGFFSILAVIFLIKDSENFIHNFLQAKSYLTANHAHAYENFVSGNDPKANFTHLIFYPVVGVLMLFLLIYSYSTQKVNLNNKFLWLSTIFLILLYFLNFQRGLVRHSLYAGSSNFTTTFFYISFALFLLFILPKYLQKQRNHIFILAISMPFFFTAFPFPIYKEDYFCKILEKYKKTEENLRYISLKTNRVINQSEYENNYFKDLKVFFDNNFEKDETFLDFSNTPMLYFNLKRQIPSYFCQYMQNTITPFLQEENLKLIRKSKIPVAIFSNEPNNWFDFTDGVPNTLRYSIICKYIYENYVPLTIINNHSIWIKKDLRSNFKSFEENIDFAYDMKEYHLRKYPYLLGKYGNASYENLHEISINDFNRNEKIEIPQYIDFQNGELLIKVLKSEKTTNAKLIYYNNSIEKGVINFEIQKSDTENTYVLPINYQYNWYCGFADSLTFETDVDCDNNIFILF